MAAPATESSRLTSSAEASARNPRPEADTLHVEGATVLGTTFNTLCNVVGGGVLSLPFAVHNSSIIVGVVLIALCGLAGGFASYVLVCGSEATGKFSEAEVIAFALFPPILGRAPKVEQDRRAFRRKTTRLLVTGIVVFSLWMSLFIYAKIIAESVPPVIRGFFDYNEGILQTELFWLVIPGVVFAGMTTVRKMSELKWSSLLGFATILYCILIVVVRYFTNFSHRVPRAGGPVVWFELNLSLFATLTTVTGAFCWQFNTCPFYRELKERSPERMMKTVYTSMPIIGVCYAVTGVLGYLLFGPAVAGKHAGNVMTLFPDDDVAVNIGRLLLFFHFVCVFPILSITCRRGAHDLLLHIPHEGLRKVLTGGAVGVVPRGSDAREGADVADAEDDIDTDHVFTTPLYINAIESFIIVTVAVTAAAFVEGIGVGGELSSALSGVFLMFVGPGLVGVSIWSRKENFSLWLGAVAIILLGTVCSVVGTVSVGFQVANR